LLVASSAGEAAQGKSEGKSKQQLVTFKAHRKTSIPGLSFTQTDGASREDRAFTGVCLFIRAISTKRCA